LASKLSIIEAIEHPKIFKPWFRDPATWSAWRAFLRALFGLEMSDSDRATYQRCTGRIDVPAGGYTEAWLCCGRRGGKSLILALVATFLACFVDWRPHLSPGERATVMIVAADRRQSRVIFRYIRAFIAEVKMLASLVQRETMDTLDLSNGLTIEIVTSNFRTIRGSTVVACLCDEIAFWRSDDAANPDSEILAAIRPAMATIPGAMLLCASSPYAKRGVLYDAFKRYHSRNDAPILTWQASTIEMNPTIPQHIIDDATEVDPERARSEYGAQFRSDISSFVDRAVVEDCIDPGVYERPVVAGTRYVAFVDPSGGSSDSMTLAIGHVEAKTVVIDAIRKAPAPFSPDAVVREHAALLRHYRVRTVVGDRYAGEWPREKYREHGIRHDLAELARSELYLAALAQLNSRTVRLLDNKRLVTQLCNLERRTSRLGRDTIDHPEGGHDDVANAVAGVIAIAIAQDRRGGMIMPNFIEHIMGLRER
jgi:hypothetical protein